VEEHIRVNGKTDLGQKRETSRSCGCGGVLLVAYVSQAIKAEKKKN